jgi:hypothetical protein
MTGSTSAPFVGAGGAAKAREWRTRKRRVNHSSVRRREAVRLSAPTIGA